MVARRDRTKLVAGDDEGILLSTAWQSVYFFGVTVEERHFFSGRSRGNAEYIQSKDPRDPLTQPLFFF